MVEFVGSIGKVSELLRDFLSAEEYSYRKGFLQEVDNRLKMVGIFLLIFLAVLAGAAFSLALLSFSLGMVLLSRVSLREYLRRFGFIPLFAIVIALPWIFMTPGRPILVFMGVTATIPGIMRVVAFSLRVTACVSCISLILFTTRTSRLLHALRSLRVPGPLVDILGLVYRYLFTFLSELRGMLLGRKCRIVSERSIIQKWKEGSKVAGNFLSRVFDRSERVYKSMKARGYDGRSRIYKQGFEMGSKNVVFLIIMAVMVGVWLATVL